MALARSGPAAGCTSSTRAGEELYDLRSDPYQMKSLHASKKHAVRQRKQSLARDLRALRNCAGRVEC